MNIQKRFWKQWTLKKQSSIIIKPTLVDNTYFEKLKEELNSIDNKIADISRELINSQVISWRYNLSTSKGLFGNIQRKLYGTAAQESANWHKDRLLLLHKERRLIQKKIEKANGTFWINQIRQWLKIFTLIIITIFCLWIILMGLITALYLLPICGLIFLTYWLFTKNT